MNIEQAPGVDADDLTMFELTLDAGLADRHRRLVLMNRRHGY